MGLAVVPHAKSTAGTAANIGRRLVEDAVWYRERCNWLGVTHEPSVEVPHTPFMALGGDLYSGAAGVSFVLAQLYVLTGEESFARTAAGGMRTALHDSAWRQGRRDGLYSGLAGTAAAATIVAGILGSRRLATRAGERMRTVMDLTPAPEERDVVIGAAGTLLALLSVPPGGRDRWAKAVRELGDHLVETGVQTARGLSWRSKRVPAHRNLTGFSHGAAGIAHALLELYALTGESRYRDAAERGLRYERSYFDPATGNWPDFRKFGPAPRNWGYAVFWCHGAPGIAISRLRAFELLGDPVYRAEALVALETTRDATRGDLGRARRNLSLCHGLTGNAAVLRLGARMLGESFDDGGVADQVEALAEAEHERDGATYSMWTEANPTLMLGSAGIAHFYAWLADSDSALVLAPTCGGS